MTEIVAPLLLGLPLLGSEHLLAVLVFLGFSGAGNPADLAPNLPAETMAYVRLTHRPEAAALVKKALEGARGEDGEFRILMDRLLEKIEKEGGFRERGFRELASRITGIHFVVYGFSDDGPFFSLVFEMTGEEAALEVLDHSDRFFQEPIFQKLEGEGKYRFGPAEEAGNCLRVRNLLVFGNRAEETVAGLRTAPVASLASSKTYQAAVGESGTDAILLAYGDGQKFFSALRGVLD
ncbi:MAG: hypothetical protein HY720_17435, partial [Planctomycetes bacterium]|nr:hypothetical protein [Planctomycetota bacterium]